MYNVIQYLIITTCLGVLVLLIALVQVSNKLTKVTDERDTIRELLEAQHQVDTVLDGVDDMSIDAVTIWLRDNDAFANQGGDVSSVEGNKTTLD